MIRQPPVGARNGVVAGQAACLYSLVRPSQRVVRTTLRGTGGQSCCCRLALILAGGLAYTAGMVVLWRRWPDQRPRRFGYHEVWHLFTSVRLMKSSKRGTVNAVSPWAGL